MNYTNRINFRNRVRGFRSHQQQLSNQATSIVSTQPAYKTSSREHSGSTIYNAIRQTIAQTFCLDVAMSIYNNTPDELPRHHCREHKNRSPVSLNCRQQIQCYIPTR
mmetsp:Transcript_22264/g.49736  ORF Transcript_22264/g.49736 Transcript_22264/m.49736 type:complete len:107 (-) Transcript_22264:1291-1611(-)